MASPNFDKLNIELSQMLSDGVSSALVDGVEYKSNQRDYLLNQGCSMLWDILYQCWSSKSLSPELMLQLFADFLVYENVSVTSSGSVFTLSQQSVEILSAFGVVSGDKLDPIRKADLPGTLIKSMNYASASAKRVYLDSSLSLNGNVKPATGSNFTLAITYLRFGAYNSGFYFLRAGGAVDIPWSSVFWEYVKDLAMAVAFIHDGEFERYDAVVQSVIDAMVIKEGKLSDPILKRVMNQ